MGSCAFVKKYGKCNVHAAYLTFCKTDHPKHVDSHELMCLIYFVLTNYVFTVFYLCTHAVCTKSHCKSWIRVVQDERNSYM